MNRGHTTGFVQAFGSKIQDFSQPFFPKTMTSFSRLKVLKYVIYRDLKKTQEKSFFHELSWCAAKINNFPELISILQTFLRIQESVRTKC